MLDHGRIVEVGPHEEADLRCRKRLAMFHRQGARAAEEIERRPGERQSGQRVLEEVFVGAVVEQVLGLDVEPDGAGDASADAGVEQKLSGQGSGVEVVAGHRRGGVPFRVALQPVAAPGEPREEAVR